MAAGGVSALGGILGGITSAFSNQSHGGSPGGSARQDTSTAALALVKDRRHLRELRKNAKEERLLALATDPQVMGLLVTLGGLAISCRMPFHPDPEKNVRIQGLAAASCVLMGLGRAGVGDLTTLAMAGGAGVVVGSGGELPAIEGPGGYPLLSPWGPLAGIKWAIEKANRAG